jgi:hypothetical protein
MTALVVPVDLSLASADEKTLVQVEAQVRGFPLGITHVEVNVVRAHYERFHEPLKQPLRFQISTPSPSM